MPDTDPAPPRLSLLQFDVSPIDDFPRGVLLRVQASNGMAYSLELMPHEASGLSDELAAGVVFELKLADAATGDPIVIDLSDEASRKQLADDLKISLIRALPTRSALA